MKKSIVLLIGLLFLLFTAGNAFAISLVWDVSATDPSAPAWSPDADSLTGVFEQIGFDAQTSTYQFDSDPDDGFVPQVGDPFQDTGNMRVNGLIAPTTIDTEGLNQGGYEVTAFWDNVEGYVSGVSGTTDNLELDLFYDTGTINFYLDTVNQSVFANPAGTNPDAGAGGFSFADGDLIATFSLIRGVGHTFIDLTDPPDDIETQGSVELLLAVDYLLPEFWYEWYEEAGGTVGKIFPVLDADGEVIGSETLYGEIRDLTTLFDDPDPLQFFFFTTDMNLDTTTNVAGGPTHPDFGQAVYTAYSNENGSAEMTIVPEPSTFVLLGAGLLGLAFVSRKKFRGKE